MHENRVLAASGGRPGRCHPKAPERTIEGGSIDVTYRMRKLFLKFVIATPRFSSVLPSSKYGQSVVDIWDVLMSGINPRVITPGVLRTHFGANVADAIAFWCTLRAVQDAPYINADSFQGAVLRVLWPGQIRTLVALIQTERRTSSRFIATRSSHRIRGDNNGTYESSSVPAYSTRAMEHIVKLSCSAPASYNRTRLRRRSSSRNRMIPVAIATPVITAVTADTKKSNMFRECATAEQHPSRCHTKKTGPYALPPPSLIKSARKYNHWIRIVCGWCGG